ncbi:hypothetical protein ACPPVU_14655 [Mucilaginibacter sp. McL0603]|uniref:hypothetical protein n=1 Tax=Mucilaginibacter sp. McL0603 TaxID=3415670 RepID=UPI003CFB145F
MKFNENIRLLPITIDSAILLGIITALGYECTFLYEKSYCDYFSIPSDFITVDLNSVVPYWTQTINIILICFFSAVSYYKLNGWLKGTPSIARFISWNFLILSACYITYLTTKAFEGQNFFYTVIIVATNITLLIISITHKIYNKRKQHNDYEKAANTSESDVQRFYSTVRLVVFGVVILFVVLNLNLSEIRGKKDASAKHEFLILNNTSTVIIRAYSDRLICKDFDFKNKKFLNKIRLIKIGDNTQFLMALKELGPINLINHK